MSQSKSTIIVGAGWAGLAAALTLTRQGQKVILLEAAPQAGGRARGISFGSDTVDNGQHLLLGAYTQTLALLKSLHIPEEQIFKRTPFEWVMLDLNAPQKPIHIKLPEKLNFLQGLMGFLKIKGLSLKERLSAMHFCRLINTKKLIDLYLKKDMSVEDLLIKTKQPVSLIQKLWGPLALAALSTPIQEASAQVFVKILQDILVKPSSHLDYLFPKVDLSTVLPNPIIQAIKQRGSSIFYHQRVQALIMEDGQCKGVKTATREFYADHIILATPPPITAEFHYQPITTVYLKYAKPIELIKPMIGFINATLHWMFDRRFAGQPNILSIVITGKGPHTQLSHAELIAKILTEIKAAFPKFQEAPLDWRVVTEKRAAFSCDVGINQCRPAISTAIPNLWRAGDYLEPSYPATLESAIRSGVKAAQLILSKDAILV